MADRRPCVCGCGRRSGIRHHAIYAQECRRVRASTKDARNLVAIHRFCHEAHHSRRRPLELRVLPDSVFEFAVEALGAGAAYVYLRRRYRGSDPRLDALVAGDEPEAA